MAGRLTRDQVKRVIRGEIGSCFFGLDLCKFKMNLHFADCARGTARKKTREVKGLGYRRKLVRLGV